MTTFKELVYMVLDELKLHSDDAYFTEDHIIFLLNKYRAFLLKQRYSDVKKQIPESNYQTITLDLKEVPTMAGDYCINSSYMRSIYRIPSLMPIGNPSVHLDDFYGGEITLVSKERMKYVGENKYLKNIIYASIGPDKCVYLKSANPQYLHLTKINITGIFEDPQTINQLQHTNIDILDTVFPIEEGLIPPMVELIVKELSTSIYRPEDNKNNAKDDLSEVNIK